MFELVNNTDKSELLKNVLSINNQSIAVRDYINREKLTYKCYTCNKIGHFTKNCKLKDKLCPKCNNANCSGTCQKQYGNVPIVTVIIVLLIGDAPH